MCHTTSRYFCGCCFDYVFWTHPFIQDKEWYLACQKCYNRGERGILSMAEMKADIELYKAWCNSEQVILSEFSQEKDERLKQIETRINILRDTLFEAKAKIAIQFEEFDKVSGRKGLSPYFRADREKLITDPNIDVNFSPKDRKESAPKAKKVSAMESLGLSADDMKAEIAAMRTGKKIETPNPTPVEIKPLDDSKKNDLRERLAARKLAMMENKI